MFKISFPEQGPRVKPHYCTNFDLAAALEVELFERFGDCGTIEDHPYPPHYDPGGPIFDNRPTVDLGLVKVNSQHTSVLKDLLLELIEKGPRKVDDMEYYKLHCPYTCIVLTVPEANVVLSLLSA